MKKHKMTILLSVVLIVALIFSVTPMVLSHCEIPCGIYDDAMRLNMMDEHAKTIEKAMNQIKMLRSQNDKNYNQLVRWIMNKDDHADQLSHIVTQYFMKQRIKPAEENEKQEYKSYVHKLTLLHKIMVYSMKCKQTTNLENVAKLKEYLKDFRTAYAQETHTVQQQWWTCSMHPQIRKPESNKCPICGMELVPFEEQDATSGNPEHHKHHEH